VNAADARATFATEARRYDGTKEIPPNRGIRVDYWNFEAGADPKTSPAWCASFASQMGVQAFGRLGYPLKRSASVQAIVDDAKTRGLFTTDLSIAAGRAVLAVIFFPTLKRYGHILVVAGIDVGARTVAGIEGNSNDDGSRDGYEVVERAGKKARPVTDRFGFILWPDA
jgi:hypothetical protein